MYTFLGYHHLSLLLPIFTIHKFIYEVSQSFERQQAMVDGIDALYANASRSHCLLANILLYCHMSFPDGPIN